MHQSASDTKAQFLILLVVILVASYGFFSDLIS
jgi:hypothetical protein